MQISAEKQLSVSNLLISQILKSGAIAIVLPNLRMHSLARIPFIQDLLTFSLNILDECKASPHPKEFIARIISSYPEINLHTASNHSNPLHITPPGALHAASAPNTYPRNNVDRRIAHRHHDIKNDK